MAPTTRRILFAAVVALCLGLTAVVVFTGWSINPTVKAIETLAVAPGDAGDVEAFFRERERRGLADAARSTGDDGNLVIHRAHPFSSLRAMITRWIWFVPS